MTDDPAWRLSGVLLTIFTVYRQDDEEEAATSLENILL